MRERDAAVLTSGAVAIAVLFVLLIGNVFVYVPLKAAYFGPAHTTTATAETTCAQDECKLTMTISVVGAEHKLDAVEVYAVDDTTTLPDRPPDAVIERPRNTSWNDATLHTDVPDDSNYLLVARQDPSANDLQWAAEVFDETPNQVIIDRVDTTEQE